MVCVCGVCLCVGYVCDVCMWCAWCVGCVCMCVCVCVKHSPKH